MNLFQTIPMHVCQGKFKNYSYVIVANESSHCIVIDPAWEKHKYKQVFEKTNSKPNTILLTHWHHDHTNLVEAFVNEYDPEIWISENDRNKLYTYSSKVNTFSHSQKLRLNDLTCSALCTPGHTAGSSCFLFDNYLFSGDTLFIEGCGICLGTDSNPKQLYKSIQFLKNYLPPNVKIFPGHRFDAFPGQTFEYVKRNNIYLHFQSEEDFINFRMRKNQGDLFNFK